MSYSQEAFGTPSKVNVLTMSILQYLPESVVRKFFWHVKSPRLDRIRHTYLLTRAVAKRLVEEKAEAVEADRTHKDVMSLIGRSLINCLSGGSNYNSESQHFE